MLEESLLSTYQELGAFGFLLVTYVGTVWFLIKMVIKDKERMQQSLESMLEKEQKRTEAMAKIVQENTDTNKAMINVMSGLEATVRRDIEIQSEFITYLKTRDQFQGRGGSHGA